MQHQVISKSKLGISVRITLGVLTLVALVLLLASISYYSLTRFQDDVKSLSSEALPALSGAAQLNTELENVVLNVVQLARVQSHAERRISISESREALERVQLITDNLKGQYKDLLFTSMVEVLSISVEDLNTIKSRHLDKSVEINKIEGDLNTFTIEIGQYLQEVEDNFDDSPLQHKLFKWQSNLSLITLESFQISRTENLKNIRSIQKEIRREFTSFEANHLSSNPELLSYQLATENKLKQIILGREGLFKTATDAVRLRLRVQGLERQTRVLVNEMIKSMATLSETINSTASENTSELITLADEQIQYIMVASLLAFTIGIVIFVYFDRNITSRLLDLNVAVVARAEGEAKPIPTSGNDEIAEIGNSVSYFIKEIDERQERILANERQFRSIVEGSVQAIIIIADDSPLFWNSAFSKLFGLNTDDNMESHRDIFKKLPKTVFSVPELGEVNSYSRIHLDDIDGEEKWVDLVTTGLIWNDTPALQMILADVTQHMLAEKSLASAKARAEELTEAKSQFLATMSHEIRSPMNGIITMSDLLSQSKLDSEQANMTGVINRSAQALLSIINDILDFSKIEAGKLDIEKTPFNLHTLIREVADLMAPKFSEKGLELIVDVDISIPSLINGDPNRLRQILINLIGNAEKFTETGHVTLKASHMMAASVPNVAEVTFQVVDTGIGIDEHVLPRLFTPFEQAETSTARRFGGSGLGLSICKRLTELQGGSIGVNSIVNVGSDFFFTIPYEVVDERSRQTLAPLNNAHIIMRSRAENTDLWKEWIELAGGNAFVAQRHDDISKLSTRDTILLLDYDQLSDDEVLRTLVRRTVSQKGCKVALLTPAGLYGNSLQNLLPFDGNISKPAHPQTLTELLASVRDGVHLNTVRAEEISALNYTQPSDAHAASHGCLILVVEDNPVNQIVIQKTLKHLGFAFHIASNGEEALEKIQQNNYGLILSDLHMPVMNGMDFTIALRQLENKRHTNIPVIALTADILKETKDKCREIGMNGFLSKPIEMDDLEATICEWLPAADQLRRTQGEPVALQEAPNTNGENKTEPTPDHMLDIEALFDSSRIDFIFETDVAEGQLLVSKFLQTLAEKLAETQATLHKQDYEAAKASAHAAKGAAGSVGALEIHATFKQMEEALTNQSYDYAVKLLAATPQKLNDFERAVILTYSLEQSLSGA
ncbi:hybrid sensor histidine kinase/response regulator [Kordiimonas laminariae]|uniref:hybrid sensor histidine kinase/response regulator n=1 Tax=Kordiimonas laminariae TaxID=2917717 RepID=UPI001FF325F4|nr:ATP-binding protein [Kordiimonas laminariae]